MKLAIVISRFNPEVTTGLLQGAQDYLQGKNQRISEEDVFWVPGAFEIPLVAQALVKTQKYSGIICLGCVIQGDTAHFEFISLGTTVGLMQSMLSTQTPLAFGLLTTYNDEQALDRSRQNAQNKGKEAAAACLETAELLLKISGETGKMK